MKAAVVYGINDLRLEEIEKPQIERDDQILVKIKAVGICVNCTPKVGQKTTFGGAVFL